MKDSSPSGMRWTIRLLSVVLFFLFIWSIPLVIAEFAIGKRTRVGTVGSFRILVGRKFAWMGLWTAWISTATDYGLLITGFGAAFWGALIISIVNFLLGAFVPDKR